MDRTLRPAIGLRTRRLLAWLLAAGELDEPCFGLLERALAEARPVTPASLVFELARSLGAEREAAIDVAAFCELFYAACSLTDDLQDGDAQAYLPELSAAARINVMAQLLCAVVCAGSLLRERLGDTAALDELLAAFRAGVAMLTGQRLELSGGAPGLERFRRIAELSAGRQFTIYFRLAALAAGADPSPLSRLAPPFALLLQLGIDQREADPRLDGVAPAEIARLRSEAIAELEAASAEIPQPVRGEIVGTLRKALPA